MLKTSTYIVINCLECGKVFMARSDKRAVSKMNAWFATQQRTISVASSRLTEVFSKVNSCVVAQPRKSCRYVF